MPLLAGRYQVLDKLGEGGMGEVFRARDTKLDRAVAVKMLPSGCAPDREAVARFQREARALARLAHPGIIQAHDSGEEAGRPFLVMELVEGRSLAAVLREQGRIAPARAADFAYQAALALHHAHQNGLVHRDVKPSNLLLSSDGRLRLLDLGLARFLQDQIGEAQLTRTGMGLGTPDYVAPEQLRDARHADARSDIYSLGCTLYHLIAGRVPFPGSSFSEKVEAHETREPTPLEELSPDMPAGLVLVVQRMLAKRPADRFASMAEVADALAPHIGTSSPSFRVLRTTSTWDGSRLATLPVLPRRRRLLGLGIAVAIAGLLLALGLLGWAAGWFRPGPTPIAEHHEPEPAPADTGRTIPGAEPTKEEAAKEKTSNQADDPNVLTVSQDEKDGGKYRTLNAALDQVRPGQTIRVLDEGVYRERLAINSPSQHHDITIEAPRHAILERSEERGITILIQGVPGVTVRGFHLRSAAKDLAYLVGIVGLAPGTVLEQLELEGGKTAVLYGVEVEQVALADADRPLIVQDCLFRHIGVGIRLSGVKNDFRTPEPNRRVMIRNNRFARCHQPVGLRGSFRDVFVVGNLIWNASGTGIQVQNVLAGTSNALIANNTLLECAQAIVLRDDKGKKTWGEDIRVRNNLILGSQQEDIIFTDSVADSDQDRGDGDGTALAKLWRFDHNGREWKPAAGVSPARSWVPSGRDDIAGEKLRVRSRDPSQADFLRPDPQSPLASAGAGKEDPSLPSYVGALPPEGTEAWDWDHTWRMPPGAQLLTVSREKAGGGEFRTLKEALAMAKPWATIRVLDEATYAEAVELRIRAQHEGITLEAPRRATLAFPAPAQFGVVVLNVPHVTVRGFRIRIDRQPTFGVGVGGRCPGLTLDGLELRGTATRTVGITVEGATGTPEEPIVIRNCTAAGCHVGIQVHGYEMTSNKAMPSRAVLIQNNRVSEANWGFWIAGRLNEVQVTGNRVWNCGTAGIRLANFFDDSGNILIANNTVKDALHCVEVLAPVGQRLTDFGVCNNLLLAEGSSDFVVDGTDRQAIAGWRIEGNWRRVRPPASGTTEESAWVGAARDHVVDRVDLLSTEAGRPEFLRPPSGSPLATAGAGHDLPAYVGAVPPEGVPAWDWDRTWRARAKKTEDKK
jgi:serine/threonine protein kinase